MPSPRLLCKQRYKMRREGSIYKEWGKRKPKLQAFSSVPVFIGQPSLSRQHVRWLSLLV